MAVHPCSSLLYYSLWTRVRYGCYTWLAARVNQYLWDKWMDGWSVHNFTVPSDLRKNRESRDLLSFSVHLTSAHLRAGQCSHRNLSYLLRLSCENRGRRRFTHTAFSEGTSSVCSYTHPTHILLLRSFNPTEMYNKFLLKLIQYM